MRKTVAVDVDGVLADYSQGWKGLDHIGDPIPGAADFLLRLAAFADVLIYTTRCSCELGKREAPHLLRRRISDWLTAHGMEEGKHWHDIWTGQGKPIFAALVDDRAVGCRPQDNGATFEYANMEYQETLRQVRWLLNIESPGCSFNHKVTELSTGAHP